MPNWVINRITLRGSEEDINKCLKTHIVKEEEGEGIMFDFNTLIPMPQDLRIEKSSRTARGIDLFKKMGENADLMHLDKETKEELELGRKALENEKKYGYRDWYDWSIAKWGTKWNSCNTYILDGAIYFDTAWSPISQKVLIKLSELYPDLDIYFDFAEEQTGYYAGHIELERGKIVFAEKLEEYSKEAYELYFELWGGDENYKYNEKLGTYEYIGY